MLGELTDLGESGDGGVTGVTGDALVTGDTGDAAVLTWLEPVGVWGLTGVTVCLLVGVFGETGESLG